MKPDYRKSRIRRIILLYAAGVVIPGIVLGYMAFRGIQNDQAIREKESRNRMEQVRESFFKALDSTLYADFQTAFAKAGPGAKSAGSPYLKAALVIPAVGPARLISHQLLYLPLEFADTTNRLIPEPVPEMEEAQKLEFATGRLDEALIRYQSIAANTTDNRLKLGALLSQARLLRKLKRDEDARLVYERIAGEFANEVTNTGIPAQPMAWLELAKMHAEAGKLKEKNESCRYILNSLQNPKLILGASYFNFMFHTVKELADQGDTTCQELLIKLDQESAQTARIGALLLNPEQLLSNRNTHIIALETGLFLRPLYFDDLIGLSAESHDAGVPGQMLLTLDLKSRFLSIAGELISKADPDGLMKWQIRNGEESPLFTTSPGSYNFQNFAFPDGYPEWSLSLYESQPSFVTGLLAPGRGVFLLIFVFITAMMVFGLFFTLYTLNQEIRLNALKSDFISNVSHELKSPLTSIRLRAEMLTENRVPSQQKPEYYSNILDQSEHLSHLIENILDFSRIEDERKKYRFEDTSLVLFLQKIAASFNHRQIGSKIRIEYAGDLEVPGVMIDQDSMQQVIYNLLDNACKFSGESEKVVVGIKAKLDEVVIWVRDWGMGISKKDQARIFDRFYRAEEGRNLGIKGSGIGLTLVKRIVEAHKGTITVESEPGKGSTFWIHLPVRQ